MISAEYTVADQSAGSNDGLNLKLGGPVAVAVEIIEGTQQERRDRDRV